MQGISYFIPTEDKAAYLNLLLQIGFDTLDFGSFVSPKAVPQMADTAKVLDKLDLSSSSTKLLAIVANSKGIDDALQHSAITYLGYPFSISETFQKRNTNSDISTSLSLVEKILNKCHNAGKRPVIYLSMAFGNPYGEQWDEELVSNWTSELVKRGAAIIALSDTIGAASPQIIANVFRTMSGDFPDTEFGVHLHSTPDSWKEKVDAAYRSGCRRFDAAIRGYGGCPMAADTLTGNIATENLIQFLDERREVLNLNRPAFAKAMELSTQIFH